MRVRVLGTGTSSGVPQLACDCSVCVSSDPRNQRLRCGLAIELDDPAIGRRTVLVDTPTDLRQQALKYGVSRVDAVLYTHAHADHILGADDLRAFNLAHRNAIRCFGSERTLAAFRRTFAYAFDDGPGASRRPRFELEPIASSFELFGRTVEPVPVLHGELEVFGYRLDRFAYVTDVSFISEESLRRLEGLDTLILGALRYRPHPTHFSIPQALEVASRIGARRTYLTHLTHEVDHGKPEVELPAKVEFAYDGLELDFH